MVLAFLIVTFYLTYRSTKRLLKHLPDMQFRNEMEAINKRLRTLVRNHSHIQYMGIASPFVFSLYHEVVDLLSADQTEELTIVQLDPGLGHEFNADNLPIQILELQKQESQVMTEELTHRLYRELPRWSIDPLPNLESNLRRILEASNKQSAIILASTLLFVAAWQEASARTSNQFKLRLFFISSVPFKVWLFNHAECIVGQYSLNTIGTNNPILEFRDNPKDSEKHQYFVANALAYRNFVSRQTLRTPYNTDDPLETYKRLLVASSRLLGITLDCA